MNSIPEKNPTIFADSSIEDMEIFLQKNRNNVNLLIPSVQELICLNNSNRIDILDLIIKYKANLNHQDDDQMTILHYSCFLQDDLTRHFIERLITAGIDGSIKNVWGETAFHTAAKFSIDPNIILILLPISDPNALDLYGNTPLMLACLTNRSVEIIQLLINYTNDIGHRNYSGENALDLSIRLQNNNAILALL